MKSPLDALYLYACERGDLTHWLMNEDIVDTFHDSVELAEKLSARLLTVLAPEHAATFQKFLDNAEDASHLEGEMLFYQGLAMGLRLGSMTCSA